MNNEKNDIQDGNKLHTIQKISATSIKIQRSEFIANLYPVSDLSQIKDLLAEHNSRFKDASHNCYAYVLGKKQETQYYSDQGEPSGTAGKPILNILLHYNLTNVLAIVTRYYGGIKLGVRGLIDAYSQSTEQAINQSETIDFIASKEIHLICEYNVLDILNYNLQRLEAQLEVTEYSEKINSKIIYPETRQSEIDELISGLTQKRLLTIIKPEEL